MVDHIETFDAELQGNTLPEIELASESDIRLNYGETSNFVAPFRSLTGDGRNGKCGRVEILATRGIWIGDVNRRP